MAIKDIFTMIKADRYTSDGREELIKAQEAVTEDVTYKPGDISRKTGLQKQPDGSWAPVKNAPAQKKGLSGKTLTKEPKHFPTVGEYAENGPIEQRMAMKKLLEKNGTESGSGVPIKGDNWMSLPSGTRMTFEGAKEKMAQNNARIETLKKAMEGNSKADNFRLGSELKRLQNENEYISERLPPEKTESTSASGSAPSMTTEQRKKWEGKASNPSETKASLTNFINSMENSESFKKANPHAQEIIDIYKTELKKREDNENYRPEKVYSDGPSASVSGSLREQTPEEIQEIGRAGREWRESQKRDAEERQKEVQKALAEQMKKEANSSEVKIQGMNKDQYIFNTMMERHIPREKAEESWNQEVERVNRLRAESSGSAPSKTSGTGLKPGALEEMAKEVDSPEARQNYDDFMKAYKERERREISGDSAPRILTGDCKVRIKKSK